MMILKNFNLQICILFWSFPKLGISKHAFLYKLPLDHQIQKSISGSTGIIGCMYVTIPQLYQVAITVATS